MKNKETDIPFTEEIWKEASNIAKDYRICATTHKYLGFIGDCAEMPTVFFDGETEEECKKTGREAITVTIATMLEMGRIPPKAGEIK